MKLTDFKAQVAAEHARRSGSWWCTCPRPVQDPAYTMLMCRICYRPYRVRPWFETLACGRGYRD